MYEAPKVEVIEVEVEKGFAVSGQAFELIKFYHHEKYNVSILCRFYFCNEWLLK